MTFKNFWPIGEAWATVLQSSFALEQRTAKRQLLKIGSCK
jgi:hypothetical protein